MDFSSFEGFEEFFSDGVLDPSLASSAYREAARKYPQLAERVALLHDPEGHKGKESDPSESSRAADFDIVFLHGIGSDEFKCWTNEKGVLWPAVFIPQDFPRARVLSVGYAHALWNWKTKELESTSGKEGSATVPVSTAAPPQPGKSLSERKGSVWESLPEFSSPWKSIWGENGSGDKSSAAVASSVADEERSTKDSNLLRDATEGPPAGSTPDMYGNVLYDLLMQDTQARVDMQNVQGPRQQLSVQAPGQGAHQLQSFRLVAADIIVRLLQAGVGAGQRPVVFVVHSMGGLITKQIMVSLYQLLSLVPPRRYMKGAAGDSGDDMETGASTEKSADDVYTDALRQADRFLHSVRGVVFYGTPHFGSGLASVITGLQRYYCSLGGLSPTNVVKGLGDHNREALTLLNDRFMDVISRLGEHGGLEREFSASCDAACAAAGSSRWPLRCGPCPGISLLSFGESKKLNGLVQVVEPESANPFPDDPRYPFYLIDGDHCQINRPIVKTSPSYSMLYGFLDRLQQRGLLQAVSSNVSTLPLPPGLRPLSLASSESQPTASAIGGDQLARDTRQTKLRCFEEEAWESLQQESVYPSSTNYPHDAPGHEAVPGVEDLADVLALLRSLREVSNALREDLARFFGRVVPPELDGIFLLSTDVMDSFHSGKELLARLETPSNPSNIAKFLSDAVESHHSYMRAFSIPVRLLLYWLKRGQHMIHLFEQTQYEEDVSASASSAFWLSGVDSGTGVSPDSAERRGGAGGISGAELTARLSTQARRELEDYAREVAVLQGEWEGFRRYLSVAMRGELVHRQLVTTTLPGQASKALSLHAMSDDRVVAVFFARAVRAVLSASLKDGGCLSAVAGQCVKSAVELAVLAQSNGEPTLPTPGSPTGEMDSLEVLLTESLELYTGPSVVGRSDFDSYLGSLAMESATSAAAKSVRAALPAVKATSYFLLACCQLQLCERPERAATARLLFESATRSLDEFRLSLRASSRAARRSSGQNATNEVVTRRSGASWWSSAGFREKGSVLDGVKSVNSALLRDTTVAMEAFGLLCRTMICISYVEEVSVLLHDSDAASPKLLDDLSEAVRLARTAHTQTQRALDGHADELSMPFIQQHGADANSRNVAAQDEPSNVDKGETAKKAFRDAVEGMLKELDDLVKGTNGGNRGQEGPSPLDDTSVKQRDSTGKGTKRVLDATTVDPATSPSSAQASKKNSGWVSKTAGSVPRLIINSLLSAWDTVRRGGSEEATPALFASNTMVFWWGVEEYACWLVRELSTSSPPAVGMQDTSRSGPGGYRIMRDLTQLPRAPSQTAPVAPSTRAPVALHARPSDSSRARRCGRTFSGAHTRVQCNYITASAYGDVMDAHQRHLTAARDEVRAVLVNPNVDAEATVHRVRQLLVPSSPSALGDAVQLDRSNPLTHCLLGHWYFLTDRSSPDAAHSYARAMRCGGDPHSLIFLGSAVGLGWVHLHRVSTALSADAIEGHGSRYRRRRSWEAAASKAGLRLPASSVGNGGLQWAAGRGSTVVDSLAMRAAPAGFAAFCGEAIGLFQFTASLANETDDAAATCVSGARPALMSGQHLSEEVARKRLYLAEEYFRQVLRMDPTNVGALCGLGRVHSLAIDRSTHLASYRRAAPGGRGGPVSHEREAAAHFHAAIGCSSASESLSPRGRHTVQTILDPTFRSYAAYWLGSALGASGDAGPPLTQHAAPPASRASSSASLQVSPPPWQLRTAQHWYECAVKLDPFNDWALTSLGLGHFAGRGRRGSEAGLEPARGLALLEVALCVNPGNQWALWGIAQHHGDAARRAQCLRALRSTLYQRLRMGW